MYLVEARAHGRKSKLPRRKQQRRVCQHQRIRRHSCRLPCVSHLLLCHTLGSWAAHNALRFCHCLQVLHQTLGVSKVFSFEKRHAVQQQAAC